MHLIRKLLRQISGITLLFYTAMTLWTPIAQASMSDDLYKQAIYMLQGDIRYTRNNLGALFAQIPPSQLADSLYSTFAARPQIYARYHPESATGRIDVVTLRKLPNGGVELQVRPWSPKDGSKWARHRNGNGAPIPGNFRGLNPFAAFYASSNCAAINYTGAPNDNWRDPWDRYPNKDMVCDEWRNLNPSAFFAAVGMAMKYYRSDNALVGVAETRINQGTREEGNIFVKKTTTYLDAYVKPHWYMGTAYGRGGTAMSTAYCVVNSDPSNPCPQDLVVDSGANFVDWNKGDLNTSEYHAFNHEESKSGLGFISFIITAFVLAWAGGVMLAGLGPGMTTAGAAASVGSAAGVGAGVVTAGAGAAATWGAAAYGLASAGIYAGLSIAISGNAGIPLSTTQNGFLGNINNGVLNTPTSGSVWDPTPSVRSGFSQANPANVPGAVGQEFNKRRYQQGDWQNPQDAYSLKRQRDQGMTPQLSP
ncbi:hypothetical protein HA052_05035 [Chromobacterium haemolyticum]|uniref:Uncharacterized protein n=1 Tax=Chromobacterium fluminis TaxID=3044269 RepID=A0ABX0L5C6_9NEIS|nr:hypothetical protein [Chromobacterium haemolyticum]NHR04556.1 hypothetical protein [Chromobacterium haemolyticum]